MSKTPKPNRERPEGQTVPVLGERQQPAPRAPHERDESASSQAPSEASQKAVGRAALDSVRRGQTDTDKGSVLDATYKKEFRR